MPASRLLVLVGVTLLMGTTLVGAPAAAKKSGKCPRFNPVPPRAASARDDDIASQPVIRVTDAATQKKPVVVEFEQEASVWWWAYDQRGPVVDGNRYFNVQVDTKKDVTGLHVRLEWPLLAEELDLYMFHEYGSMVAWSEVFNQIPAGTGPGGAGGPGFEYIAGFPVARCTGFVIEDNAMLATPQTAQLKLWLGPIEWTG